MGVYANWRISEEKAFFHAFLSGPVLRDAARLSQRYPLVARYGVLASQHGQFGAIPPSPFSERSPFSEHAKWRCDTPAPPTKGVSQRYLHGTL